MSEHVSISHPTGRPNFTIVDVGPVTLWFSYRTVIAFQADGPRRVTENVWGPTTGKHLNYIGDKACRVPREQFLAELEALTARLSIALTSNVDA